MRPPDDVFNQTVASLLAPVTELLAEDSVSEIMINGHEEIYIERSGCLQKTNHRFATDHSLMSALRNLAQFVGRELDANRPVLEARLPDGSRVQAVIPPVSPLGPVVCIRRPLRHSVSLDMLVEGGSIDAQAVALLRNAIEDRDNIVVAGGSGSGKTSLLGTLARLVSPRERIVVIEDSRELRLGLPHVVQLEARPGDESGRGAVHIRDLVRATLRLRPDRIIIGEIRGGEALDLIQAMTSGHRGCLSTVHATLPLDTLSRLETMALMSGVDVPLSVLRVQLASAVDTIVQVERGSDGCRHVTHVAKVRGFDAGVGYGLALLYERNEGERR